MCYVLCPCAWGVPLVPLQLPPKELPSFRLPKFVPPNPSAIHNGPVTLKAVPEIPALAGAIPAVLPGAAPL